MTEFFTDSAKPVEFVCETNGYAGKTVSDWLRFCIFGLFLVPEVV
jgi:hypothetical protein